MFFTNTFNEKENIKIKENKMIKYIKGDATYPEKVVPEGVKLIVHIVNDIGAWGAGFVLALNKRWPQPKALYRSTFDTYKTLGQTYVRPLGQVDIVRVDKDQDIYVVNLVGQTDIRPKRLEDVDAKSCLMSEVKDGLVMPVRYDAIYNGLCELKRRINQYHYYFTLHMPKIGSGLAGGNWSKIEKIINEIFKENEVYVYEI